MRKSIVLMILLIYCAVGQQERNPKGFIETSTILIIKIEYFCSILSMEIKLEIKVLNTILLSIGILPTFLGWDWQSTRWTSSTVQSSAAK
jgi:hypothetical protein